MRGSTSFSDLFSIIHGNTIDWHATWGFKDVVFMALRCSIPNTTTEISRIGVIVFMLMPCLDTHLFALVVFGINSKLLGPCISSVLVLKFCYIFPFRPFEMPEGLKYLGFILKPKDYG